jgi:putative ABC transport system permease protein
MPLPVSYLDRLKTTEGVALATHQSWFGVSRTRPTSSRRWSWSQGRSCRCIGIHDLAGTQGGVARRPPGAVVGVDLLNRFGWKVGDRIPILGTIWQPKEGQIWEFNIAGTYDGGPGVDKTQFFFRYDYLDENRRDGEGLVGWYVVKIDDAGKAQQMASTFDGMFANSSAETKTTTEKGFVEGFAKQVGDIGAIMIAITVAVLFTMILVAANTMAQSVRERTSEVGVLKTLGFSNASILALVLGESLLIAVLGGGLGLATSWLIVQQGDPTNGMLPIFMLPTRDVTAGAVMVVVLGVIAGLWPALNAMNLKITDALRRS